MSSEFSDTDVTLKVLGSNIMYTKLPDSPEIEANISLVPARIRFTKSFSSFESEVSIEEQFTSILFKRKKVSNAETKAKFNHNKMLNIETLPTRVITRLRKPTIKLKDSSMQDRKTAESIFKSKFLAEQEDNIDKDIIIENISRLKSHMRNRSNKGRRDINRKCKEINFELNRVKDESDEITNDCDTANKVPKAQGKPDITELIESRRKYKEIHKKKNVDNKAKTTKKGLIKSTKGKGISKKYKAKVDGMIENSGVRKMSSFTSKSNNRLSELIQKDNKYEKLDSPCRSHKRPNMEPLPEREVRRSKRQKREEKEGIIEKCDKSKRKQDKNQSTKKYGESKKLRKRYESHKRLKKEPSPKKEVRRSKRQKKETVNRTTDKVDKHKRSVTSNIVPNSKGTETVVRQKLGKAKRSHKVIKKESRAVTKIRYSQRLKRRQDEMFEKKIT